MISFLHFLFSFGFDWEDLYQTLNTVFNHISKHLKVHEKINILLCDIF